MPLASPYLAPSDAWSDVALLHALEEAVEHELNRHLAVAKEWMPHEYVPWSEGRTFDGVLGGEAWAPEQSTVSEVGRTALVVNLLTEDNLPSYHYEIATIFGRDGAWGTWVHRWTAEEGRHAIVMRDYLLTTRAVDPCELERFRMQHVSEGFEHDHHRHSMLHSVAYVAFQELATRVSHRNTGRASGDPVCERMLAKIATDENLHMVFYRNLLAAALQIAPDLSMQAIRDVVADFRMPGHSMPGFERAAARMAIGGIYNLRIHHDDVLVPVLRHLKVLDRGGLSPEGLRAQQELGLFMDGLKDQAARFDERRAALLARRRAARA